MILVWSVLVPILIAIVYFIVGWSVSKHLIKNGTIETPLDFWFYFVFWFPAFIFGAIFISIRWMLKLPRRLAEKAINKYA